MSLEALEVGKTHGSKKSGRLNEVRLEVPARKLTRLLDLTGVHKDGHGEATYLHGRQ